MPGATADLRIEYLCLSHNTREVSTSHMYPFPAGQDRRWGTRRPVTGFEANVFVEKKATFGTMNGCGSCTGSYRYEYVHTSTYIRVRVSQLQVELPHPHKPIIRNYEQWGTTV